MSQYRAGIGTQPSVNGGFAPRGLAREAWTAGAGQLSRPGGSRGLSTAPRAQSLPAQPAASNPSKAPPPRPAPPKLERAGDMTGRLLRDYLSGWTSQYTEYDYYVPAEAVHGTVPEDIRGTLFLIGPALMEAYGTAVRHPSDGDGMVCSLAFGDGGQIFFRNRYVRTASFVAEQTVGRRPTRGLHDRGAPIAIGQQHHHHHQDHHQDNQQQEHRHNHQQQKPQQQHRQQWSLFGGAVVSEAAQRKLDADGRAAAARAEFDDDYLEAEEERNRGRGGHAASAATAATPQPRFRLDPLALLGLPPPPPLSSLFNPLDLAFRAPANASVLHWAGRLLAFTEGGSLPYELNKLSLETVGLYDVAGAMADIGRLVGGYKIAPPPPVPGSSAVSSGGSSGASGGGSVRPQRLVLMGAAQSGQDALLRWVEVGEDGRPAGPSTSYRMPGALAQGVRDFWVTDRYYVVMQARVDFNPERFATQAVLGTASFAECFDWDASRPGRIHLIPRPAPAPSTNSSAAAAGPSSSSSSGGGGRSGFGAGSLSPSRGRTRIGSSTPIVWPPKGPQAIIVDSPPLLPISCVGCYSPTAQHDNRLLVLDAICQQGVSGTEGGMLDSLEPEDHRRQPKPELTRLVVDLHSRTATARVISQRTASAATTAAALVTGGGAAATAAASYLAPVGHGGSFAGGYHHLYAAAAAGDAADGWAPSQVLLKLAVPPDHCVPLAAVAAARVSGAAAVRAGSSGVVRRRGIGAEVWSPGERVFVGPPVFVPRKPVAAAGAAGGDGAGDGAGTEGAAAAVVAGQRPGGVASPLPPLESEVEAAARGAAAVAAARRREDEQDGWLLVLVHDAESMTAELCVLDARDVTRGPVAVISLPHHLPHVRGAHFTRSYCGPGLAAPPGWRPRTAAAAAAAGEPAAEQRRVDRQ